jgi:hypothetical protein
MTATPSPTTATPSATTDAYRAGLIASLNVISAILAARAILALSVLGAFVLALETVGADSPVRLVPLALYALTIVCPLVWLASRQ